MTIENYSRALVTGATAGIGRAICLALAREGIEVLAVARRQAPLDALAEEIGCQTLMADVRDSEKITVKIAAFKPDIIINNAGVGHGITGLDGLSPEDIADALNINVVAPIQITAAAVEMLKAEGIRGHVINLGSIAGLHTLLSALYGAGKGAIHIFSQNLRYELRGYPIRVTEICPGRTTSEFYDTARGDAAALAKIADTNVTELKPADVAETVLFALKAPLHVNISTIEILPTEQVIGGASMTPVPKL